MRFVNKAIDGNKHIGLFIKSFKEVDLKFIIFNIVDVVILQLDASQLGCTVYESFELFVAFLELLVII